MDWLLFAKSPCCWDKSCSFDHCWSICWSCRTRRLLPQRWQEQSKLHRFSRWLGLRHIIFGTFRGLVARRKSLPIKDRLRRSRATNDSLCDKSKRTVFLVRVGVIDGLQGSSSISMLSSFIVIFVSLLILAFWLVHSNCCSLLLNFLIRNDRPYIALSNVKELVRISSHLLERIIRPACSRADVCLIKKPCTATESEWFFRVQIS